MQISVVRGADAEALLADDTFAGQWAALERACPWATVFQSRAFVRTWSSVYRARYEPVLVVGTEPGGEIAGLLPLALEKCSGALVAAGAHHAEYQGWLARHSGGEYITAGLAQLRASLGIGAFTLSYLPPGTPLGWTASEAVWARRCTVRAWARPLMDLGDVRAIEQELQRKKIRYLFRTLERHGPVTFERLTRPEELEEVFDDVIRACDLRQYAYNGVEPFGQDPLKRPLHVALMRAGLLHATVMRAGVEFAAAQLNWCNKGEVLLGVLAHSPFFARSSPGTLHLLHLARELAREGRTAFDLSPGGDPGSYKERFATRHDTVHSLSVLFGRREQLRVRGRQWVASTGKRVLASAGITPARVKALVAGQEAAPTALLFGGVRPGKGGRLARQLSERREVRLYAFDLTRLPPSSGPAPVRRDSLADVLAPSDAAGGALRHRRAFLTEVLRRIERGEHVYTRVEGGQLVHVGSLSHETEVHVPTVGQRVCFPAAAALLRDFYTHPGWRGRGICSSSLRHVLAEAAQVPGTRVAYAAVDADAAAGIRVLERVGFTRVGTLHELRRLGVAKRWAELPHELRNLPTATGTCAGPEARLEPAASVPSH